MMSVKLDQLPAKWRTDGILIIMIAATNIVSQWLVEVELYVFFVRKARQEENCSGARCKFTISFTPQNLKSQPALKNILGDIANK